MLLDISMPGKNGLEILKELKTDYPKLPVLILSIYPEEQYAIRALKAGAAGYLTKESAPHELISAIRKISAGGRYISASLAEKLAAYSECGHDEISRETLLPIGNIKYMRLIASGKTVSEIAKSLQT